MPLYNPTGLAAVTAGATYPGRLAGVTDHGVPTSGTYAVGDMVASQDGQFYVCVTAGTPGTWVTPRDLTSQVTTGEEVFSRELATSTSIASATGNLRVSYFTCRKGQTTTQVRIWTGGTAAAATPTVCRIGLYLADAAGNGSSLVASTTNDTALFAGTSTSYTKAWTSSYVMVAGQRYAVGALVVSGAATPTFLGTTGPAMAAEAAAAPALAGVVTGLSDLPASFSSASAGTGAGRPYVVILP